MLSCSVAVAAISLSLIHACHPVGYNAYSFGQFGSECLLKAICEIARAPLTEVFGGQTVDDEDGHEYTIEDDYGQNIYHALINAIFTWVYLIKVFNLFLSKLTRFYSSLFLFGAPILRPHLANVEQRYWDARVAGSKGANCDELFAKCSAMNDWLKRFTRFIWNEQTQNKNLFKIHEINLNWPQMLLYLCLFVFVFIYKERSRSICCLVSIVS